MTTKSYLFAQEPNWRENRAGIRHTLPVAIQSWTYETGSLTQRLRGIYGNSVAVTVLYNHWQTPYVTERHLLKQSAHRYCLIREVLLHADGKPLILARTIIPEATVNIAKSNLSHLGNRPLGEIIFAYPKLQRLDLNLCVVSPDKWSQAAIDAGGISSPVWGRRTVYAIAQRQMLVSEFFLPELLNAF
ncbi:MAG: chorismate lyase [Methylococcaceae bacterium]|nr:chorismate lyase [Methylococcaceae bacterium]MDZ4155747.1 chorismate lyase [Methylococcales bacterium]MDP2391904.1 chorismate lyase [Methylococcaceae bacterium]MDP3018857.1 chorismate lyase [Methylococcaceae bacterium]MDP3391418.1 chorismate lyase [Methylococcaceae bacterium]